MHGPNKKKQVERNEKGLEEKRNNSWIKKSKGDHGFFTIVKWAPSSRRTKLRKLWLPSYPLF
jgi:hypothetical protein